mmetsp:Transcript_5790/g.10366  ORF Transcript_5790/g.10366 Transcript_5790/m.10366 type:complete len:157 (+) Transcript_5790:280-750(+)
MARNGSESQIWGNDNDRRGDQSAPQGSCSTARAVRAVVTATVAATGDPFGAAAVPDQAAKANLGAVTTTVRHCGALCQVRDVGHATRGQQKVHPTAAQRKVHGHSMELDDSGARTLSSRWRGGQVELGQGLYTIHEPGCGINVRSLAHPLRRTGRC